MAPKPRRKTRRTKILTVWLEPKEIEAVDEVAERDDSDRSKFVRTAVREKLARDGVSTKAGDKASA